MWEPSQDLGNTGTIRLAEPPVGKERNVSLESNCLLCTITSKVTLLTMQVLEFSPINESLSTCVNLLSRNGV
jgi:hypothetical protein